MGRRRSDWVQLALVLIALLSAVVHVESRIARLEQHLEDQDRDNAALRQRIEQVSQQVSELQLRK